MAVACSVGSSIFAPAANVTPAPGAMIRPLAWPTCCVASFQFPPVELFCGNTERELLIPEAVEFWAKVRGLAGEAEAPLGDAGVLFGEDELEKLEAGV